MASWCQFKGTKRGRDAGYGLMPRPTLYYIWCGEKGNFIVKRDLLCLLALCMYKDEGMQVLKEKKHRTRCVSFCVDKTRQCTHANFDIIDFTIKNLSYAHSTASKHPLYTSDLGPL